MKRWWGQVRPGVQHVLTICHEPTIPEDVYTSLVSNRSTLFLFFVAQELKGFSVVETCADAGGKYLNVWILHFIGGCDDNRQELLHWIDTLAKSAGCVCARFTSPRAWAKLLSGSFKEKAVIYEREVK